MRTLISLYALRYGCSDLLTEVAEGLASASEESSDYTKEGNRIFCEAATLVFGVRNGIERLEKGLSEPDSTSGVRA